MTMKKNPHVVAWDEDLQKAIVKWESKEAKRRVVQGSPEGQETQKDDDNDAARSTK